MKEKILCSAEDFGFGPAGKLLTILSEMSDIEPVFIESEYCKFIDTEYAHSIRFNRKNENLIMQYVREHHITTALVLLDQELALWLSRQGLRVIFVDSLPYLWTKSDPVCENVYAYCAQKTIDENVPERLKSVRNLKWVGPISSAKPYLGKREDHLVLLNIGGVYTHIQNRISLYPEIVVPTIANLLKKMGYRVIVAGRIPEAVKSMLEDDIMVATLCHNDFLDFLKRAELLVTSPGLTTIIDAGITGTRTILLPPQNLSQILNTQLVSQGKSIPSIFWPKEFFDYGKIDKLRFYGESCAVNYIFDSIEAMYGAPCIRQDLADSMELALTQRTNADWAANYVSKIGKSGVDTVVNLIYSSLQYGDSTKALSRQ